MGAFNKLSSSSFSLLLLWALFITAVGHLGGGAEGGSARWPKAPARICRPSRPDPRRRANVSVAEFGGVGDGRTLNTLAFQNAVSYLAEKGGGHLHVPPGKWLTGSFNLTSHLTLFLHRDALILGSQDFSHWPVIDPLPSYGRGRELPGGMHISLIYGANLTDVIITGDNGTIDGQGSVWWEAFRNKTLDFTRGPLIELVDCTDITITNITLRDSPFFNIHTVYCRNVFIQFLTILAPTSSPNTDGIDPDSCTNVCIQDCFINNGDDLISVKSGWDEYGIAYGRPSRNIVIRNVVGTTRNSAGFAIGSEMSGGVSNIYVDNLVVFHADSGLRVKTSPGRGGYVRNVYISNVTIYTTKYGITIQSNYNEHPDNGYDPNALPSVERIFFKNVVGKNLTHAGRFLGLSNEIFKDIFLSNISFNVTATDTSVWNCSFVQGSSKNVFPAPCAELQM